MEPVKISNVKDWSSIDIYLFSNGQQYSPPRKYHLRSEELQWWATTISYLGRTHYGSGHSSIEIYTLDGTKINGPLELINGAAYVAVEPPDSFINTGYEDYLLKASRSREKREAQKTYSNEIPNTDIKCNKGPTEQNTTDDNNVLYIPENIAETASLNQRKNSVSSPVTTRLNKPQQRLQRKSITCTKQIQKKKSFDTHTAALKRICTETEKVFPCPKKTFQKKNACANRKPSNIDDSQINENQKQQSCCKRRTSLKPKYQEECKKNDVQSSKIYQLFPFDNDSNLNTDVTEKQPDSDFCNDKVNEWPSLRNDPELYSKIDEVEQDLEKNNLVDGSVALQEKHINDNEIDHNQTFYIESRNKLNHLNENDQSDIPLKTDFSKNDKEQFFVNNIPKSTNYEDTQSYNNENKMNINLVSEKQISDEYVAHMNKGGILLLKFKIKLKDCKTIFNRDNNNNLEITKSLSNILKTEKTSQVDINIDFSGELLKSNNEQCTQNKSLQSLLNKLCTEGTDAIYNKNSRIIILQCACRNNSDNHKYCMCENLFDGCEIGDKKCETTFLDQKFNETRTSCDCHNEPLRVSIDEKHLRSGSNVISDNRPSISKANGSRVKHLAQKFEVAMPTKNNNNLINTSMNENHQPAELTRLEGTGYDGREENHNSRRMSDKSTQTEWCNILLEARCYEDNNYSFHLPSLYLLKQFNV